MFNPFLSLLALPIRYPFLVAARYHERRAFRGDIESAWQYCETIWNKPFAHAWCQLVHMPFRPPEPEACRLIRRFVTDFPGQTEFLIEKARTKNPVIAAYAMQCLEEWNAVPSDILARTDTVVLRDFSHEVEISLGEWAQVRMAEEEEAKRFLEDDCRQTK